MNANKIKEFLAQNKVPYLYVGIFLISAATLHFELLLLRLYSVKFFFSFVHTVLNLAMLGAGAGCSFLAVSGNNLAKNRLRSLFAAAFLFLCSLLAFYFYFVFWDVSVKITNKQIDLWNMQMVFLYIISGLPFLLSGYIIAFIFKSADSTRDYHLLYFANLLGAGAGSIILYVSLNISSIHMSMYILILETLFLLYVFSEHIKERKLKYVCMCIAIIVSAHIFVHNHRNVIINSSVVKIHTYNEDLMVFRKWSPMARVDVETTVKRTPHIFSNRISAVFKKPIYGRFIYQDYTNRSRQLLLKQEELSILEGSLYACAFLLHPKNIEACIIGVGGGVESLAGIYFGAKEVVGVELNPIVHKILVGKYEVGRDSSEYRATFTGQDATKISFVNKEGRSYLKSTARKFDSIQITAVRPALALAAGAYNFNESNLFTKEAVRDYFDHLRAGGILVISERYFDTPREGMKIFTTVLEVLREMKAENPKDHVVIIRSAGWEAMMAKKDAKFTKDELNKAHRWAQRYKFHVRYMPESNISNKYYKLVAENWLDNEWRMRFIKKYPYVISPATDNCPYFYQYYKNNKLFTFVDSPNPDMPISLIYSKMAHYVSLCGAIIFIFGPLIVFRYTRSGEAGLVFPVVLSGFIYFGTVGFCYIIIELLLIANFQKFLGGPIFTGAFIIPTMLISTGFGSIVAGYLKNKLGWALSLRRAGLVCLILTIIYGLLMNDTLNYLMAMNNTGKIIASLFFISVLGLSLGIFFPTGLTRISKLNPRLIPWAFAINFSLSVIGANLAPNLFYNFGFKIVFIFCGALYVVAAWIFSFQPEKDNCLRGNQGGGDSQKPSVYKKAVVLRDRLMLI